jgi:hypothetical protein
MNGKMICGRDIETVKMFLENCKQNDQRVEKKDSSIFDWLRLKWKCKPIKQKYSHIEDHLVKAAWGNDSIVFFGYINAYDRYMLLVPKLVPETGRIILTVPTLNKEEMQKTILNLPGANETLREHFSSKYFSEIGTCDYKNEKFFKPENIKHCFEVSNAKSYLFFSYFYDDLDSTDFPGAIWIHRGLFQALRNLDLIDDTPRSISHYYGILHERSAM